MLMPDYSEEETAKKKIEISEVERARMSLMNPELIRNKNQERTIDEAAKSIIGLMLKEGIETVWDRFEIQQPPLAGAARPGSPAAGTRWGPAVSSLR
jgi:hypothetical protein